MRSTLSMPESLMLSLSYERIRTMHFNFKVTQQKYSSRFFLSAHWNLHKNQQSLFNLGSDFQMPFLQQFKEHTAVFLQTLLHNGSLVRRLSFFNSIRNGICWTLSQELWLIQVAQDVTQVPQVMSGTLCQISPRMDFSSHLSKVKLSAQS